MAESLLELKHSKLTSGTELVITGSKSESNRALILQALYSGISLKNLSNSDDTQLLQEALSSKEELIDIHHAGTAMRFLTAFFASRDSRQNILSGSSRMKERPIKILVDALRDLGAQIKYLEQEGFPPLGIKGKTLPGGAVELEANISSQYISALLLIAPSLRQGLSIKLNGTITSRPYIQMTLSLLKQIGVTTGFEDQLIDVQSLETLSSPKEIIIESDWSSASYFYSLIALSELGTEVKLTHYFQGSLQGDAVLQTIYESFGVATDFLDEGIVLRKKQMLDPGLIKFDLTHSPDIAQTIAVTCFGLGLECFLTGLHTLKIKETDRLEALKSELTKLGAVIEVTEHSLKLAKSKHFVNDQIIETYNDHRMAMAFAPLALRGDLRIKDPQVVSKSYPDFWKDMSTLGLVVK